MEQYQNGEMGGSRNKMSAPLIGGVVLVVVLAILGWYVFHEQRSATIVPEAVPTAGEADAATASLNTQGTSDELSAIDADVNATDLSSLNDVNTL